MHFLKSTPLHVHLSHWIWRILVTFDKRNVILVREWRISRHLLEAQEGRVARYLYCLGPGRFNISIIAGHSWFAFGKELSVLISSFFCTFR